MNKRVRIQCFLRVVWDSGEFLRIITSGLFKILKTSREMDCFVNEGGQNEQI